MNDEETQARIQGIIQRLKAERPEADESDLLDDAIDEYHDRQDEDWEQEFLEEERSIIAEVSGRKPEDISDQEVWENQGGDIGGVIAPTLYGADPLFATDPRGAPIKLAKRDGCLVTVALFLFMSWSTVIAFRGGVIPLLGWEMKGSVTTGILWLLATFVVPFLASVLVPLISFRLRGPE